MTDKLDLSLPQRPSSSPPKTPVALFIINLIILAVLCVILALVLFSFRQKLTGAKGPALSNESLKKLALKLEDQGLDDVAAAAWKDYLSETRPGKKESARIWFRIGKLYQDAQQYDQALAGYYRSEQFAPLKDLSPDIARREQDCLESAGKFAALRDELAERVGLQENNSGKGKTTGRETVVAEIGPQKITLSDLDHEIEKTIDQQIARIAPYLPEDIRNQQKEKMLKQFSSASQRQQFLSQYIAQELLYREARASNLTKDPEIRSEINDQERALLADRELQKTYADNIKITDADLQDYYKAHPKEYQTPERAKISLIAVKTAADAARVRKALKKGKNFADVAKKYSIDEASAKNGGKIDQWIEKGQSALIPEISDVKDLPERIFSTDAGKVISKDMTGSKGIFIVKVDAREPEKQKSFDEVKNEVYSSLYSQDQQEVQKSFFDHLKNKYDVVIHTSVFAPPGSEKENKDNTKPQSSNQK